MRAYNTTAQILSRMDARVAAREHITRDEARARREAWRRTPEGRAARRAIGEAWYRGRAGELRAAFAAASHARRTGRSRRRPTRRSVRASRSSASRRSRSSDPPADPAPNTGAEPGHAPGGGSGGGS